MVAGVLMRKPVKRFDGRVAVLLLYLSLLAPNLSCWPALPYPILMYIILADTPCLQRSMPRVACSRSPIMEFMVGMGTWGLCSY